MHTVACSFDNVWVQGYWVSRQHGLEWASLGCWTVLAWIGRLLDCNWSHCQRFRYPKCQSCHQFFISNWAKEVFAQNRKNCSCWSAWSCYYSLQRSRKKRTEKVKQETKPEFEYFHGPAKIRGTNLLKNKRYTRPNCKRHLMRTRERKRNAWSDERN